MATTTPNFGWPVPTSTDLVKDGATAIESLGDSIDASLLDLKGGTTGQVLSKTSNTDLDFTWTAANPGDITGVTAGTGISGGGTSGTVTISIDTAVTVDKTTAQTLTNKTLTSPALTTPTISTLTTNGDLIYGTGSGAISRLGIGTSGQVLTVAAGVPSWATAGGGATFAGVGLTKSSGQSLSNATYTAISWDGEGWDTDAFHDNTTNNSRVTIPSGKAGKYLVTVGINYSASGVGSIRLVNIYKNGSGTGDNNFPTNPTFNSAAVMSKVMDLAVGDYIQAYCYQDSGGALTVNTTATFGTSMQVTYLGA
jgi:hypothetical protein